jgi:hypothetical protein
MRGTFPGSMFRSLRDWALPFFRLFFGWNVKDTSN